MQLNKKWKEIVSGAILGIILAATAFGTCWVMSPHKSKMQQAEEQIKTQMKKARTHAYNHNIYAAVVIPETCRKYRLCKIGKTDLQGADFHFKEWLSDWEELPSGLELTGFCTCENGQKNPIRNTIKGCPCEPVKGFVIFTPRGTPVNEKEVHFTLESNSLKTEFIIRVTGYCKIQRGNFKSF